MVVMVVVVDVTVCRCWRDVNIC